MRNLLIALTGFLVGTALFVGLLAALPNSLTMNVKQTSAQAAMPQMGGSMAGMKMGSRATGSASLASVKLTIRHVTRGCHVWVHGGMTGAMMRLHLKVGQSLSVLDQDVDAHRMMQLAGPVEMHMGGPMMTNHGMTLTFMKKGVYRLGTKTVEMPGMGGMDVKTIGPDNKLRLVVTVA